MAIKYDNCKNCHSLCIHAGKDRKFVCINGVSCKITMEKPQTNADRIRAMSDEELAELLADETYRIAKPCFDAFGLGLEKQAIYVKRLDWLQQPAKGE